jgi:hypothetical protein
VANVEAGGTAVIGVDDRHTRATAERVDRAGKKVMRVSVTGPVRDGYYADGTRILCASGGKPKTGGIASLAEFFPHIRKAYLIGEAAHEFAATLDGKVPYELNGVLAAAIEAAARDAAASDAEEPVVLLSPACASFDQYRNFEVRGDSFRDIVFGLPGIERRR